MRIQARHYANGRTVTLGIENDVIRWSMVNDDDSRVRWIAPSFFDPQINGAMGVWFNSPSLDDEGIAKVVETCLNHGIGGFCPTVITDGFDAIERSFRTLRKAVDGDKNFARRMPCFHLEGPFIACEDGPRGAHPKEHCRNPSWDEFQRWQDAAGGLIRMVTLAPERTGAIEFIENAAKSGVVVAIGHTAATAGQIHDAVSAGARTSTHLGNGSHAVLPRHDNYIWHQMANDNLWASIIPDGHHLTPSVVKSIVRAKTVERTLITCDASSLAGLPPGKYREWGTDLEVLPNGKIVLSGTPYLAGSGVFTDACVSNIITMAGITLGEAIDMASIRPRELLGLPIPTMDTGDPVELIEFDWEPGGTIREIKFV